LCIGLRRLEAQAIDWRLSVWDTFEVDGILVAAADAAVHRAGAESHGGIRVRLPREGQGNGTGDTRMHVVDMAEACRVDDLAKSRTELVPIYILRYLALPVVLTVFCTWHGAVMVSVGRLKSSGFNLASRSNTRSSSSREAGGMDSKRVVPGINQFGRRP
jgi:hypothetical protein